MKKEPLVSVIIPVHNRPRELQRAVESVLAQTYANYEIIIVDDCSTDNTFEVVQKLEQKDSRIHGFRNEKNGGGAYTRNQGIARSRGTLVAFLDSDDEWLPEKLDHQIRLLEKCDSHTVISTYFVLRNRYKFKRFGEKSILTGNIREQLLKGHFNTLPSCMLLPKEFLNKIGGFSSDLQSMQDYDLWMKLSEFYTLECVPEYLVQIHTDANVRISINPSHRISGINGFLNKWSDVIEREVGKEYVGKIRNTHLGTVFFTAAVAACRAGDRVAYRDHVASLRSVGQVTKKRFIVLWVCRLMLLLRSG
jgi:glycosyltransferase involved in cell wall biosynthesis